MITRAIFTAALVAAHQGLLVIAVPNDSSGDSPTCWTASTKSTARAQGDESSLLQVFESVKRGSERGPTVDLKLPAVGPAGLLMDVMEDEAHPELVSKPSRAHRLHASLLEFSSSRQSVAQLHQAFVDSKGGTAYGIIVCIIIVFALIAMYWVLSSNAESSNATQGQGSGLHRESSEGMKQGLAGARDCSSTNPLLNRGFSTDGAAAASASSMIAPHRGGIPSVPSFGDQNYTMRGASFDGGRLSFDGGSSSSYTGSYIGRAPGRANPAQQTSAAKFHQVAASHLSPVFGGQRLPASATCMSPGLEWATVPANGELCLVSPMLSVGAAATAQESSKKFSVGTKDGCTMISLGFLRHKMDQRELETNSGVSEYVTLGLPEEDESQDLVMCAIGRQGAKGLLEAQVYLFGKLHYGTIREDPGGASYTLTLANNQPTLTATVQGYGSNRRVTIVSSTNKNNVVARAEPCGTTLGSVFGQACYDVHCFPLSDILLNMSMLACVDRLTVLGAPSFRMKV